MVMGWGVGREVGEGKGRDDRGGAGQVGMGGGCLGGGREGGHRGATEEAPFRWGHDGVRQKVGGSGVEEGEGSRRGGGGLLGESC